MKKWAGFFVFTLLLSLPISCSTGKPENDYSVNPPEDWIVLGGGYSVSPPDGWTVSEFPGSPYKGLFGTRVDDFTPNINIQEDNYSGPMDAYVRLNMIQLEKLMKAKKISESSFSARNHDGVKLIAHTQFNDLELTQTFYFFENPKGKKVVVVATANRSSGSKYDPVFDSIMSTFQME